MAKAMTVSEFIRRAKEVHGDAYDYSRTVYTNMQHKVPVVCPKHGEFMQMPQAHLKGQGCPVCGREKQRETMLDRYGAANAMQVREFFDKARKTSVERYGHAWAQCNPDVHAKTRTTNHRRYGADYPMQSEEIKKKAQETIRERYEVDFIGQNQDFRDKAKKTCVERYGMEEPLAAESVRKKIAETNLERYGGTAPMCSADIRAKTAKVCLAKYGVKHPTEMPAIVDKICDSKRAHGTFGTSVTEDVMYDDLCNVFGSDDVVRQYRSAEYHFDCDFYIRSRDLYIELNAHWSHGGHWFDGSDLRDVIVLGTWFDRGTDYYQNAVHVWSDADLKKRAAARNAGLNYVVFWDDKLRDARLWFSMGCPDGRDWEREYSWLPKRDFNSIIVRDSVTGTPSNLSLVAKFYQFRVFYHREIDLWNENPMYRGVPLQIWLYENRLRYKGKNPNELSDAEILRGFTISGILRGYTVFDTILMDDVVTRYGIKSVYDPCAGWGERMLYCFSSGLLYEGVDVNRALENGYTRIRNDFHIEEQNVFFGNSAEYTPSSKHDAVITCPPYGSTEIYSDLGAENLNDEDFLKWWDAVVKQSLIAEPKYFCFQVNQRWKERMVSVVEQNGFHVVEEVVPTMIRISHFAKHHGGKREYESMMVLERI